MLNLIFFCIQSINRQPLAAKKWHRSDIVFPIMQHSDCNSPFADMLSPFNNTSMMQTYIIRNTSISNGQRRLWLFLTLSNKVEKYLCIWFLWLYSCALFNFLNILEMPNLYLFFIFTIEYFVQKMMYTGQMVRVPKHQMISDVLR